MVDALHDHITGARFRQGTKFMLERTGKVRQSAVHTTPRARMVYAVFLLLSLERTNLCSNGQEK